MTWSTPPTWVAGQTIPASNLNILRDDLNETAAGKAVTAGSHFAVTAGNAIAQRTCTSASNASSGTTTSGSYTASLSGGGTTPTVSITTGVIAMSFAQSQANNSGSNTTFFATDVSGASTDAAGDDDAALTQTGAADIRLTIAKLHSLTAGSNTFKIMYKVNAGTGTYTKRSLFIIPM